MSVVAFEVIMLIFFLFFALLLFSFFIFSHLRMRGAQLVSQREGLKMHQYFARVELYTLLE
jgi:hypothetical protein